MTKTGFQNIFPVPIYTAFLDNKLADEIEDLVVPRLSNLEQVPSQKTDYFLKDKIVSPEELSTFFYNIDPVISDYSNQSNINRSNNIEYWVQDYSKNESHSSHAHGNALISGVYYIRANNNAGSLKFTNPNPLFINTDLKEGPKNEVNFEIKPQKGLLVLFPGWLLHEVLGSSIDNCTRTCLAFNLLKQ
tara:strand:+ start:398 stop:964 length:567 start_codon:yes stop_codon:yes gene_type:complete